MVFWTLSFIFSELKGHIIACITDLNHEEVYVDTNSQCKKPTGIKKDTEIRETNEER